MAIDLQTKSVVICIVPCKKLDRMEVTLTEAGAAVARIKGAKLRRRTNITVDGAEIDFLVLLEAI